MGDLSSTSGDDKTELVARSYGGGRFRIQGDPVFIVGTFFVAVFIIALSIVVLVECTKNRTGAARLIKRQNIFQIMGFK